MMETWLVSGDTAYLLVFELSPAPRFTHRGVFLFDEILS